MARPHELLCISINHRTAPLDVREGLVFEGDEAVRFLRELHEQPGFEETALVSTCNRTEIYAVTTPDATGDRVPRLLQLLAKARPFVPCEHPANYRVARDEEAVRHLFRVTSGLDSQILGESQIVGQVRQAGIMARDCDTAGRVLHRLWERALRTGKRVRTETAIGEGALSASYAALALARKVFGSLRRRHVLVVGIGEIGLLTLENLQGVEMGTLTILNRTRARADEVAGNFGGRARDFEELEEALVAADLVISSTAAREPIVTLEVMRRVRQRRDRNRTLLIIDLALPRDFDPRCGALDQVFLKNLDDLHEIVAQNEAQRLAELPRAEHIVEAECDGFLDWLATLEIEPTIRALRERFEAMREEELERVRGSVDEETLARIDRVTRRLINRLLHLPSANLRRHRALRDREVYRVLHEVLTGEIPHPRAEEEKEEEEQT